MGEGVETYSVRVMKRILSSGILSGWQYLATAHKLEDLLTEKFCELVNKVVISDKVLMGGNFSDHVGFDIGEFGVKAVSRLERLMTEESD